jgi:hypothetical protein
LRLEEEIKKLEKQKI